MGREDSYQALLKRHGWLVWRRCWLRARGDRERCRDLMQEVFIGLWLRFDSLRPGCSVAEERAWVRWVTRSVLDHQGRRQQAETVALTPELEDTLAEPADESLSEQLDDYLATLSDDDRRLMQMQLDGYCADEIAAQMGIARDAVYQRIHRAVARMRAAVLTVALLFFSSAVAVALVPQWRQSIFGPRHQEEQPAPPAPVRQAPSTIDTVPLDTCPTCHRAVAPRRPIETVEKITAMPVYPPVADPVEAMVITPRVERSGNKIIVSGVYDELVEVYDMADGYITSTICNGVCVLDIIPRNGRYIPGDVYVVDIGKRLRFSTYEDGKAKQIHYSNRKNKVL